MPAAGRDNQLVSRFQGNQLISRVLKDCLTLQQKNVFILLLIIPESLRGGVSPGYNPLQPETGATQEGFDKLFPGIIRQLKEIIHGL